MKVNTYLPVFPGFYCTHFEADETSEIDYINSERQAKGLSEITYNNCNFDYEEYERQVALEACNIIEDKLSEILDDKVSIKSQSICSPKEYNFTNDSINCQIVVNKNKLTRYLKDNFEAFKAYTKERYSSRSGFISFYSNDAKDWMELLRSNEKQEHVIGSILDFILENEEYDSYNLYEDVADKGTCYVYATNYNELIGEQ